jgi:hypothetical protein
LGTILKITTNVKNHHQIFTTNCQTTAKTQQHRASYPRSPIQYQQHHQQQQQQVKPKGLKNMSLQEASSKISHKVLYLFLK